MRAEYDIGFDEARSRMLERLISPGAGLPPADKVEAWSRRRLRREGGLPLVPASLKDGYAVMSADLADACQSGLSG